MSEKELLYYEDAISHEDATIKICKDIIGRLKDNDLILFMENEIKHHKLIYNNLLKQMEDVSNE